MPGLQLIRDLAIVLVIAGGVAWLCQRLRLSVVVGYLVAGTVIGPNTPPFALVADLERVETLAQLGLVFLVFWIGLNLNLNRLRNLGFSVIAATLIAALLVLNACRGLGWALGWSPTASLFLAGMLMVSSSAIIGKVLDELNLVHERPGQLALGMTVLEDAVAVAMLTLLTSLVQLGGGQPSPGLLTTLGGLGAFVTTLAVLSLLVAPRLLERLSREAAPEVRTLAVTGLLLLVAWGAVRAGYSLALGAFVFGTIMGSTRYQADLARSFDGLHQIFGAVFFVAVGMQVDFRLLATDWPLVLLVAGSAWMLRPVACALGLLAVGNPPREAIQAGLALTPLGEFSFVIAQLGASSGAVSPAMYAAAVGASLVTALAAPTFTRRSERWSEWCVRRLPSRVAAWVEFYHNWLTRLRARTSGSALWRMTSTPLLLATLHVLLVSALLLFAWPVYLRARAVLEGEGWAARLLPYWFWGAFGLVLLGPLIALWRQLTALTMLLAESATQGLPRARRLQPFLEMALRSVALVVLGVWLLALVPTGPLRAGVVAGVALLLGVLGLLFWRRFVHLHSRFEYELRRQFRRATHPVATSAWTAVLPESTADWGLDIDEVVLPGDSALAGRTLGELAIRAQFGCSVVGIDRQGYGLANPGADTVLFPRDKLLLLGTPEQLARAAQFLGAAASPRAVTADFDELTMETVRVPEGCPLAGRPLRELDLIRRVGVQIGGIRRGRHRTLAPSGQDRFEVGDELLVLGTHAQIKAFCALLGPAPNETTAIARGDPSERSGA